MCVFLCPLSNFRVEKNSSSLTSRVVSGNVSDLVRILNARSKVDNSK